MAFKREMVVPAVYQILVTCQTCDSQIGLIEPHWNLHLQAYRLGNLAEPIMLNHTCYKH